MNFEINGIGSHCPLPETAALRYERCGSHSWRFCLLIVVAVDESSKHTVDIFNLSSTMLSPKSGMRERERKLHGPSVTVRFVWRIGALP